MDAARARTKAIFHFALILLATAPVTHASKSLDDRCRKVMDIAIAVDTTSSETSASFEDVKTAVKGIVSGFTVGPQNVRLALISMSRQAQVVVNFDQQISLADFNAAVDRLTFSTDTVDLAEGLKVVKDSALSVARATGKAVILVKDRRPVKSAVSDAAVRTRMTSEAAGIKSMSAAILAVGVGGLWNTLELNALYGTDYLLFKSSINALDAVKSLNNFVCEAPCPQKGKSDRKVGLCYESTRHVLKFSVDLAPRADGFSVCRTKVERIFETCHVQESCSGKSRSVGNCNTQDNTVTITNYWEIFDKKQQTCSKQSSTAKVACVDAKTCVGQTADVIFIVDRSGSVEEENMPTLTKTVSALVSTLNVGPNAVRVGFISYSDDIKTDIQLGSISDKSSLESTINSLDLDSNGPTFTHAALERARLIFQSMGRQNVAKYVFLITDGESTFPDRTFEQTRLIKSFGVTLYVIGVGKIHRSELETMTAPETSTNLFIMNHFDDLAPWVAEFSLKMCLELSNPHPMLCQDAVFYQSISVCTNGRQQVSRTEYKFDSNRNCIKTVQITELASCRTKCVDPINGNEYYEGEHWSSLCHEFQCGSGGGSVRPVRSKCLAEDGTCKDQSSQPFRCLVNGVATENCRCFEQSGNAMLVIDTE